MKLLAQILVYVLIVCGLAYSVATGLLGQLAGFAPAGQAIWQQGLWPLHDRLTEEIKSRAGEAGATPERPFRVLVHAEASEVTAFRFSSFSDDDLFLALQNGVKKMGQVEIVGSPGDGNPDLSLTVVLESYTPGHKEDLLTGKTIFTSSDGKETSTSFDIRCPTHGRSWCVQFTRLSGYILIPLALLILTAGIIGVWGARDAFMGSYAGSKRMGGAVFVLTAGAFLALVYLFNPGLDRFGIPRYKIGVAVDTSDAVCFPPAPGAVLPSSGHGATNDICRFIGYCVSEIGQAMESGNKDRSAGEFLAWVRSVIWQIGQTQRQTQFLSASEGMDVEYNHPFACDGVVTGAPERTAVADIHRLLDAGHRGRRPGFFLPWREGNVTNEVDLVVAFMSGEPSSEKQARWLRNTRDRLRERRPPAMRIVSVLLPAIARSSGEDWGSEARYKNVAAISDVLITLEDVPADQQTASGHPAAQLFSFPVFDRPDGADQPASDLDAFRTRIFKAQDTAMRKAALRIAEEVRGLADVRETSIFQTRTDHFSLLMAMLSSLALFVGLQREIRALDNPNCVVGRFNRAGALLGLAFAWFAAMAIGYATAEPARWRTATSPSLVLWSVLALWYAGVWLPMLLGRGLGHLPRPVHALDLSWILRWFCVAMFFQAALLVLACIKWIGGRADALSRMVASPYFAMTTSGLVWMAMLATLALAISYGWICFWRPTRRRAFWSGYIGLIMIFALPLIGAYVPLAFQVGGVPLPAVICGLVMVLAILLPTVLPFLPLRRNAFMERSLSMGWGAPFLCLLGGFLISLLLYWPTPLAGVLMEGFVVKHSLEMCIAFAWLIVAFWLLFFVRRELRG